MNFSPSLFQNNLLPFVKPFVPLTALPNTNQSPLARLFCQALKLSLQRFMAFELQKPQKQENIQQTKKPQKNELEVIELLSSDEEVQRQDLKINVNIKQKEGTNKLQTLEYEEKTDLSKDHAQFQKDSNRTIQKQSENMLRKTYQIRKQKTGKISSKLKKHKYSRVEQKLDLTETADVRSLPFLAEQLNRKRQALFLRTVLNWDDLGQDKKERREIRMLKN